MKAPYRVGAWLSATAEEVQLLGYGMYVGDEVPPRPMGINAAATGASTWEEYDRFMVGFLTGDGVTEEEAKRAVGDSRALKVNPKIVLDSGAVVWGAECWWGPEDKMRAVIAGRRVVEVDIDDARRRSAEAAP